MKSKAGGPAFPNGPGSPQATNGMSLRDYFAAQALTGMLAHNTAFDNPDHAAEWAYQHADAMLKAREEA